ncbi:hypothetical protein V8C86DRAFT_2736087 [Haematococcus lacustris]
MLARGPAPAAPAAPAVVLPCCCHCCHCVPAPSLPVLLSSRSCHSDRRPGKAPCSPTSCWAASFAAAAAAALAVAAAVAVAAEGSPLFRRPLRAKAAAAGRAVDSRWANRTSSSSASALEVVGLRGW